MQDAEAPPAALQPAALQPTAQCNSKQQHPGKSLVNHEMHHHLHKEKFSWVPVTCVGLKGGFYYTEIGFLFVCFTVWATLCGFHQCGFPLLQSPGGDGLEAFMGRWQYDGDTMTLPRCLPCLSASPKVKQSLVFTSSWWWSKKHVVVPPL